MIRKLFIVFLTFVILMINQSCTSSNNNQNTKKNFAIYLVNGEKTPNALKKDLNDLTLENTPILTAENISGYEWSSHKILLQKDAKIQKILDEKVYMKVPTDGKPFVVVCNDDRVYLGCFWSLASSLSAPKCPTIISDFKDQDFFKLEYSYDDVDPRNNKRVQDTFKSLGKLK